MLSLHLLHEVTAFSLHTFLVQCLDFRDLCIVSAAEYLN